MSTPAQNAHGAPCIHCQSIHVAHGFCYGCGSGAPYSHISMPSRPHWRLTLVMDAERVARPVVPLPIAPPPSPLPRPARFSVRKARPHRVDYHGVPVAALSAPFSGHLFDALREQHVLASLYECPVMEASA